MATPITVKYFPKDDALDLSGNVKPMRAYASNGMLLKKLEGFYKGGSENDKSYIEYIYWGTPTSIQIDSATKWITKEIPFAVKPAPKTVKKY